LKAFREMLAGGETRRASWQAFSGVRAFPSRIKCANLRVARAARGAPEPRRARDHRVGKDFLMLDTARIRPEFPILAQQENGTAGLPR